MKQALITIEYPLRLSWTDNARVDTSAWNIGVIAGMLDGWRDVAADAASTAWRDAARALRSIAAIVAGEDETIYAVGLGAADDLTDIIAQWSKENSWVSPPRPGIPANTPEHDVLALKNSVYPPPDFVPGDVYRRVRASSFPDEEWWPCRWSLSGMAMSLPAAPCGYRERLDNALRRGDYDVAMALLLFSPRGGTGADVGTFKKSPEMLDSATLYMTAGAPAKCAVGVQFYSRRLDLAQFLASATDVLASAGYECYRSKGAETFRQWATAGKLPNDLELLAPADEFR